MKRFEENQKALKKKNISLKQGEVTVTDWLEQYKIKSVPEEKVTGKSQVEPDKKLPAVSEKSLGGMSPFHLPIRPRLRA